MLSDKFKEEFNFKRILAIIIGITTGTLISRGITSCDTNKKLREFHNSPENTTVTIIKDGELYIYSNPKDTNFIPNEFNENNKHKTISDGTVEVNFFVYKDISVEYDIDYIDDKTVIIYTYNENETKRNNVVKYIISNVYVDKNNIIYINEDNISSEGYESYKENLLNNADQDVQRARG